jgi:flagellar hook protein FlgE
MPFQSALSGLNAATQDLRVIGNNVANSSTIGFKKSRAEFGDVYAATDLGTAADIPGSGVRVNSIAQQFTQGNLQFTDNNLDLAISGGGFFRLSDNGDTVYTREGAFHVDRDGYIVNNTSQRLTANLADSNGNITGAMGELWLDTSDQQPQATAAIDLGVNLDSSATVPAAFDVNDPTTYNGSTSLTVYDSLGSSHLGTTYFRKSADNTWESHLFIDGTEATPTAPATGVLTFNTDGTLATPAGGTVSYDPFAITGAAPLNLTLNYASNVATTQYGGPFSINSLAQDGFMTGRLTGVDVGEDGIVTARYNNGESKALGQVVLANFANAQGLRQMGDSNWVETADSGPALVGAPGTASLGLVQSGALEASNVDLTEQLVNLITAQRNFQANAQVISTADTITQTIINIR